MQSPAQHDDARTASDMPDLPDIERVDPADVMILSGYFFDSPDHVERVYRKRGVIYVITRAVRPLKGFQGHAAQIVWRYDGIKERNGQQSLDITAVGWIDEATGRARWWDEEHEHDLPDSTGTTMRNLA